jgi:hypothetical protein
LQEVVALLRDADHLDADARQSLAALAEEMQRFLDTTSAPTDEELHLVQRATEVIDALHRQHPPSALSAARGRLDQAVLSAESRAPMVAGLGRRFLDVLANLGI